MQTGGPYNQGYTVTPSDTVNFTQGLTQALWVGGAGVVIAVFEDASTAAFTVTAGTRLDLRIKRVNSTSTTATLMVALYQV